MREALGRRARRHGRSMEAEVREILAAMREDPIEFVIPERTYEEPRVSF